MDILASKTGGLFNLKEMDKAKAKRELINKIISLNIDSCIAQGVPYSALGFETAWLRTLETKSLRDLKRELKLKTSN